MPQALPHRAGDRSVEGAGHRKSPEKSRFSWEKLWDLRSSWVNWLDDGIMIINHWFSHFARYFSMVTTKWYNDLRSSFLFFLHSLLVR